MDAAYAGVAADDCADGAAAIARTSGHGRRFAQDAGGDD